MQNPQLQGRGLFPRGAVALGQQWLAVCTALTSVSRQDIPRLLWQCPRTGSRHWRRINLGEQHLDTVGAGGLPLYCMSPGEEPCATPGTLFT